MLALVRTFNVWLVAEMARRSSGLDLHVVQVILRVHGTLGRPSRVASLSFALSSNDLGIGQGAKESTLELNGVNDEPMRSFTFAFNGRQPFRVACHLHLSLLDRVSSVEEILEAKTGPGVGSIDQSFGFWSVLLAVVFDELVVTVAGRLIGSADPEKLAVVGIIHTDDGLIYTQSGLKIASSVRKSLFPLWTTSSVSKAM